MKLLLGVIVAAALVYAGIVGYRDGTGTPMSGSAAHSRSSAQAPHGGCDPNYVGACLNPTSADYDCAGGEGNGPDYTGEVTVVGSDHFGLDGDGDHHACEPYY